MILLPVDEAAAFDALSILWVKKEKGLAVEVETKQIEDAIQKAVGPKLYTEVTRSPEFGSLLILNGRIFDLVEQAHQNTVSAKEVAEVNDWRYTTKRDLQRRFFNTALVETKSHDL